jgi:hypothetical protein
MLRRVLQSHPTDGDAAFNLAILLQDASRSKETTREVVKLYQISVEASIKTGEERWDAWANLASAQQTLGIFIGQFGAHACYERSIITNGALARTNGPTRKPTGPSRELTGTLLKSSLPIPT